MVSCDCNAKQTSMVVAGSHGCGSLGGGLLPAKQHFGRRIGRCCRPGRQLVYLEQQAHTNLYPPAGGFYPNGGVLNQITDKLTYQDPKTLEIQPWIAESWTVNAEATEYSFKLRSGVSFSDGSPLDAAAVAATSTPTVWATRRSSCRFPRSSTTTSAAKSSIR
jgi:ABC-type transport system substrate-binding protein